MVTVLQVLAVWLVLAALAAGAVCLVLSGARLHEEEGRALAQGGNDPSPSRRVVA